MQLHTSKSKYWWSAQGVGTQGGLVGSDVAGLALGAPVVGIPVVGLGLGAAVSPASEGAGVVGAADGVVVVGARLGATVGAVQTSHPGSTHEQTQFEKLHTLPASP
jgi:hypothetical protein